MRTRFGVTLACSSFWWFWLPQPAWCWLLDASSHASRWEQQYKCSNRRLQFFICHMLMSTVQNYQVVVVFHNLLIIPRLTIKLNICASSAHICPDKYFHCAKDKSIDLQVHGLRKLKRATVSLTILENWIPHLISPDVDFLYFYFKRCNEWMKILRAVFRTTGGPRASCRPPIFFQNVYWRIQDQQQSVD